MISIERARALRRLIEAASASLSDENALEAVELFPEWSSGTAYEADQRFRYRGKLYRVIQSHTSQDGWTPDVTPALWTEVALPGEIPVWKQPTGAQDAYMIGDKVHYPTLEDPVYESTMDNNIWSPEAYPAGWQLVE